MLLTSLLVALSILSAWCPPVRLGDRLWPVWPVLLAATLAAAAAHGLADARAVTAVVLAAAAGWGAQAARHALARRALAVVAVALAFALGMRWLPGFVPIVWIPDTQLTPDAAPFRFTASVDPGVAGLLLLACFAARCRTGAEWRATLEAALPVALATTAVVLLLGCLMGHVRPDLKWPPFAAAFLVKMLLWTCVMEEAFFRGVLQEQLMRWRSLARAPWVAVAVPAVLFGLAHFAGGWPYVGLATLAGLGYGIAYARTRRIEAAIAAHMVLNTVHFIGFTYPRLAAAG